MAFIDVVTITDRGTVTIPASLRKKLNLKPGAEIAIIEDEGKLLFIPIVDLESIRKDFPTRKEMDEELEGSHNIELELEK
ncbi:MAG TPA: AbrB/MazE/SpoVT family DNA-binding domain-containing protein [Candidatus Lokiarchaeia archaeon]|nr:AbrB/MazE/SpoVT family DNA-binding domain-containing protein [Candidatus Lokiarchaeia archaeon]